MRKICLFMESSPGNVYIASNKQLCKNMSLFEMIDLPDFIFILLFGLKDVN